MLVRADHSVKTLEDAKKKEVIVSSTGSSSPTFIYPTIRKSVLGTKFKVVTGYKGSSAGRLAMERGEVHGLTSGWISWKANVPHWIESKFMIPLVEVAPANSPDLKGVPLLLNLAKNADERKLLEFISSPAATGRAVALPPNVPKARVAALRAAFDKLVKDKAFPAAAKKRRVAIQPMKGGDGPGTNQGGGPDLGRADQTGEDGARLQRSPQLPQSRRRPSGHGFLSRPPRWASPGAAPRTRSMTAIGSGAQSSARHAT